MEPDNSHHRSRRPPRFGADTSAGLRVAERGDIRRRNVGVDGCGRSDRRAACTQSSDEQSTKASVCAHRAVADLGSRAVRGLFAELRFIACGVARFHFYGGTGWLAGAGHRGMNVVKRYLGATAALAGLIIAVWLVVHENPGVVIALMRTAGWGLSIAAIAHVLPMIANPR